MGVWRERWLWATPGVFRWAGVVMLVALPIFLITLNVRVLFNMPWVYNTGFERNDIEERTNVPMQRARAYWERGPRVLQQ